MMKAKAKLPRWAGGKSIPRILHQTYPRRELPPELLENVRNIRTLNPGWDYRFYDDAEIEKFILDQYGESIFSYYKRINPEYGAARADFFRYLLMYRIGGVYLDIKSTTTKPLDLVVRRSDQMILSKWDNEAGGRHENWGLHRDIDHIPGGELQQWHIIAAPGHPLLRAVIEAVLANIDHYRPWRQGIGRDATLRVTGPIAYTIAITPLLNGFHSRVVQTERDLGLEYSIVPRDCHKDLFVRHYSRNKTAVVLMKGINRPLAASYSAGIRARGALSTVKALVESLFSRRRGSG